MKRYLAALLALVLLLTGLTVIASAEEQQGGQGYDWEDGKYYLINYPSRERVNIPAGWYKATTTWTYDDGSVDSWSWWCYGAGDGSLVDGWKQIGGTWYYFWPEMVTGSYYDWEKKTAYLFTKDGAYSGVSATKPGWFQNGGNWYYVEEEESGWYDEDDVFHSDGDKYLWFYSNGTYQIGTKLYRFDNGKCVTKKGWFNYKWTNESTGKTYSYWYYIKADGSIAADEWMKIDGQWYYFWDYGRLATNDMIWDYNETTKKYSVYAVDRNGVLVTNKWFHWTYTYDDGYVEDNGWYYMGADGLAKTGWFKVSGKWYYADEDGWLYINLPVEDDQGNVYWLGKDGDMLLGWQQVYGTDWSYFKDSGVMVKKDWVQYGGKWYYFDENGLMVHDCTLNINGTDYKFDANGVCVG